MSYCELISFKDGLPADSQEFGNSWGGAMFIWDSVFERYLKDPKIPYDNVLSPLAKHGSEREQAIWNCWKRPDISPAAKAVWLCTFDNVLVMPLDFNQFALDLREFVREFLIGERICHLPAWADFVDNHADAEAIGFHHTSVSENPWYGWDEATEESVPYNLATGTKHWSLYDRLREFMAEKAGSATA